jgi:hypothetical protein
MPAKSKQQQKFFGVVKAMQKGDIPKKGEAGEVADDMSKKEVDKYASTKHKGLPKKVKQETMKKSRLKEIIREEFLKALKEAKMTPAKVQKVQRDLVKTIDALKKNFPMYKAAKEAGDDKKLDKHRKIALDLTKKKKDLELQMDKALGGLYQDAELELKEGELSEAPMDDRFAKEWEKSGNALRNHLKHEMGKGTVYTANQKRELQRLDQIIKMAIEVPNQITNVVNEPGKVRI